MATQLGAEDRPSSASDTMSPPPPVSPDYFTNNNDRLSASPEDDNNATWKERYQSLELQLETFRQQAVKIRLVLGERMKELEKTVRDAREKAEAAEHRVKELEKRAKGQPHEHSEINCNGFKHTEDDEDHMKQMTQRLEAEIKEKENKIKNMEQELAEQKRLRVEDNAVVEDKVAQIKMWVSGTVTKLEEENESLKEENKEAIKMISILQKILTAHNIPSPVIFNEDGKVEWSLPIGNDASLPLCSYEPDVIPVRRISPALRDELILQGKMSKVNNENEIIKPVRTDFGETSNGQKFGVLRSKSYKCADCVQEPCVHTSNTWPKRNQDKMEDESTVDISSFIPYHLLTAETAAELLGSGLGPGDLEDMTTPGSEMSVSEDDHLAETLPSDQQSGYGESLSTELLTPDMASLSEVPAPSLIYTGVKGQISYDPPCTPLSPLSGERSNLTDVLTLANNFGVNQTSYKDGKVPLVLSNIANSVQATTQIMESHKKQPHLRTSHDSVSTYQKHDNTSDIHSFNSGDPQPSFSTEDFEGSNKVISVAATDDDIIDDVFSEFEPSPKPVSGDYAELLRKRSASESHVNKGNDYQSLKIFQVASEPIQGDQSKSKTGNTDNKYQSLRFFRVESESVTNSSSAKASGDEPVEDVDYDEPPEETPDDFFTKDFSNSLSSSKPLSGHLFQKRAVPPPPPQHKTSAVEKRIYAVAESGMRMSASVENLMAITRKSSCATCPAGEGSSVSNLYKDVQVPVFTTVKGRLTMIRSTPFSGESSDSSDEEHSGSKRSPPRHSTSKRSPPSHTISKSGTFPRGKKDDNDVDFDEEEEKQNGDTCNKDKDLQKTLGKKRGASSKAINEPDYCVPPDAMEATPDGNSSDEPEPKPKLFKTGSKIIGKGSPSHSTKSSPSKDSLKKEENRRSGWLTKLGGRVKTWKKRWFVLKEKEGELVYFKTPNDASRKPRGQIMLSAECKIKCCDQSTTFELMTSKRTYYLTAGSQSSTEEWIDAIQNVLNKLKTQSIVSERAKFIYMQGWVTRIKDDQKSRCWCLLTGTSLHFFKDIKGKAPFETLDMQETSIQRISEWDESKYGKANGADPTKALVITRKSDEVKKIIILFNSKEGKDNWYAQLLLATGHIGSPGDEETEFEKLMSQVVNGTSGTSVLWKNPVLCASKETLDKPLTTLPTDALKKEAVKLAKTCSLFISVPKDKPAIDYHVTLVQNALQTCLTHRELQNEIYCQLIKQTNPGQDVAGGHATKQAWQLLCVTASIFLPQQICHEFLRMHLERLATPKTEVGQYAIYCQRAMGRLKKNGVREARPSQLEILAIIQRHPYQHILPLSIPVHFTNGSYQVVSFDGSTTVDEFLQTLNQEIGMRHITQSGFALFTDDPHGREVDHCLQTEAKVCDVISKWEQTAKEARSTKKEVNKMVRFTYCNRLYFPKTINKETDKEKQLLVYQIIQEIVEGRFPVNRELALELTGLLAQIELGDNKKDLTTSDSCSSPGRLQNLEMMIERFYPQRYKPTARSSLRKLCDHLSEKWSALRGKAPQECVKIFLNVTRRWPFFGAKLFSAKVKSEHGSKVWLAVQDNIITILDYRTLTCVRTINMKTISTFGGIKDDFMIVLRHSSSSGTAEARNEKLIFSMVKPKILEITALIASYIQVLATASGVPNHPPTTKTSPPPSTRTQSTGASANLSSSPKMMPPQTLKLKQVAQVAQVSSVAKQPLLAGASQFV